MILRAMTESNNCISLPVFWCLRRNTTKFLASWRGSKDNRQRVISASLSPDFGHVPKKEKRV